MHELPVTEDILRICLEAAARAGIGRILRIHLEIGVLNDLKQEWIQQYFNEISKDTIAADAEIIVVNVPARLYCPKCQKEFELDLQGVERVRCPACHGENCDLRGGDGYMVNNLEGM